MLDFGGYSLVKPAEWDRYMDALIQTEYPAYYQEHHAQSHASELWRSNACILESLEKYLFTLYGVTIPKDNLFKVYNPAGEGIAPELLLESITAVIEPLGFQVDRVIVPDPELRAALGDSRLTADLSQAALFEGKPGLCMINIKPGESHAFFWERMDTSRFTKEQFRMAICLKPVQSLGAQTFSAIQSVDGFCELLGEYLEGQVRTNQSHNHPLLIQVQAESESLKRYVHNKRSVQSTCFGEKVQKRVCSLLELLKAFILGKPAPVQEEATLIEAAELIRRIFQDPHAYGGGLTGGSGNS